LKSPTPQQIQALQTSRILSVEIKRSVFITLLGGGGSHINMTRVLVGNSETKTEDKYNPPMGGRGGFPYEHDKGTS